MTEACEKEERKFPRTLYYGNGVSINAEDLVSQAALLRSALSSHLDAAGRNLNREPLAYPEALGLFDIASTIYFALAENVYSKEIKAAEADNRPSYI